MTEFFRDKLSTAKANGIIGGWDAHNKQYVISISEQQGSNRETEYNTLSFDESVKGWTSLFDYKPNSLVSLNNNFFSTNLGKLYKHYTLQGASDSHGVWYGVNYDAKVTFIFNGAPSMVKNFQTINYEGDNGWIMESFITDVDTAFPITMSTLSTSLIALQANLLQNNFKLIENKYYANLANNSPSAFGEVVWGSSSSGLKGFYGKVTMKIENEQSSLQGVGKKELFAVSTGFVKSN